jgi:2-polyprenyl-3-methyl-5-hydroxy-6-metoxy-1,4-benzoquinol methylase
VQDHSSARRKSEAAGAATTCATTPLRYTPLERIPIGRPIYRIAYLANACRGKTVLDLGALDETAFQNKTGHGTWLHEEIAKVSAQVIGLDSSALIPPDGLRTARNAVIRSADIKDIESLLAAANIAPDVVVAGELIEHLENPLDFLRCLRAVPRLRGKRLLLSTPNATAAHNCLIALSNRESTHHDHLCILSFKTLNTLMSRSGYENWQIIPYYSAFDEMKQRNGGFRRRIVEFGEAGINAIELLFPLLSFGFVVDTAI